MDIVERLKNARNDPFLKELSGAAWIEDAADEIERLRAQLEDAGTEIQILELMTEGSTREEAERSVL